MRRVKRDLLDEDDLHMKNDSCMHISCLLTLTLTIIQNFTPNFRTITPSSRSPSSVPSFVIDFAAARGLAPEPKVWAGSTGYHFPRFCSRSFDDFLNHSNSIPQTTALFLSCCCFGGTIVRHKAPFTVRRVWFLSEGTNPPGKHNGNKRRPLYPTI